MMRNRNNAAISATPLGVVLQLLAALGLGRLCCHGVHVMGVAVHPPGSSGGGMSSTSSSGVPAAERAGPAPPTRRLGQQRSGSTTMSPRTSSTYVGVVDDDGSTSSREDREDSRAMKSTGMFLSYDGEAEQAEPVEPPDGAEKEMLDAGAGNEAATTSSTSGPPSTPTSLRLRSGPSGSSQQRGLQGDEAAEGGASFLGRAAGDEHDELDELEDSDPSDEDRGVAASAALQQSYSTPRYTTTPPPLLRYGHEGAISRCPEQECTLVMHRDQDFVRQPDPQFPGPSSAEERRKKWWAFSCYQNSVANNLQNYGVKDNLWKPLDVFDITESEIFYGGRDLVSREHGGRAIRNDFVPNGKYVRLKPEDDMCQWILPQDVFSPDKKLNSDVAKMGTGQSSGLLKNEPAQRYFCEDRCRDKQQCSEELVVRGCSYKNIFGMDVYYTCNKEVCKGRRNSEMVAAQACKSTANVQDAWGGFVAEEVKPFYTHVRFLRVEPPNHTMRRDIGEREVYPTPMNHDFQVQFWRCDFQPVPSDRWERGGCVARDIYPDVMLLKKNALFKETQLKENVANLGDCISHARTTCRDEVLNGIKNTQCTAVSYNAHNKRCVLFVQKRTNENMPGSNLKKPSKTIRDVINFDGWQSLFFVDDQRSCIRVEQTSSNSLSSPRKKIEPLRLEYAHKQPPLNEMQDEDLVTIPGYPAGPKNAVVRVAEKILKRSVPDGRNYSPSSQKSWCQQYAATVCKQIKEKVPKTGSSFYYSPGSSTAASGYGRTITTKLEIKDRCWGWALEPYTYNDELGGIMRCHVFLRKAKVAELYFGPDYVNREDVTKDMNFASDLLKVASVYEEEDTAGTYSEKAGDWRTVNWKTLIYASSDVYRAASGSENGGVDLVQPISSSVAGFRDLGLGVCVCGTSEDEKCDQTALVGADGMQWHYFHSGSTYRANTEDECRARCEQDVKCNGFQYGSWTYDGKQLQDCVLYSETPRNVKTGTNGNTFCDAKFPFNPDRPFNKPYPASSGTTQEYPTSPTDDYYKQNGIAQYRDFRASCRQRRNWHCYARKQRTGEKGKTKFQIFDGIEDKWDGEELWENVVNPDVIKELNFRRDTELEPNIPVMRDSNGVSEHNGIPPLQGYLADIEKWQSECLFQNVKVVDYVGGLGSGGTATTLLFPGYERVPHGPYAVESLAAAAHKVREICEENNISPTVKECDAAEFRQNPSSSRGYQVYIWLRNKNVQKKGGVRGLQPKWFDNEETTRSHVLFLDDNGGKCLRSAVPAVLPSGPLASAAAVRYPYQLKDATTMTAMFGPKPSTAVVQTNRLTTYSCVLQDVLPNPERAGRGFDARTAGPGLSTDVGGYKQLAQNVNPSGIFDCYTEVTKLSGWKPRVWAIAWRRINIVYTECRYYITARDAEGHKALNGFGGLVSDEMDVRLPGRSVVKSGSTSGWQTMILQLRMEFCLPHGFWDKWPTTTTTTTSTTMTSTSTTKTTTTKTTTTTTTVLGQIIGEKPICEKNVPGSGKKKCGPRLDECWDICDETKGFCDACNGTRGTPGACCMIPETSGGAARDPQECHGNQVARFATVGKNEDPYHACVLVYSTTTSTTTTTTTTKCVTKGNRPYRVARKGNAAENSWECLRAHGPKSKQGRASARCSSAVSPLTILWMEEAWISPNSYADGNGNRASCAAFEEKTFCAAATACQKTAEKGDTGPLGRRRLPRNFEEVEAQKGTGCGFDNLLLWTTDDNCVPCACANGTPLKGERCGRDGNGGCEECREGFELVGKVCKATTTTSTSTTITTTTSTETTTTSTTTTTTACVVEEEGDRVVARAGSLLGFEPAAKR